jgi:hypothetical protein
LHDVGGSPIGNSRVKVSFRWRVMHLVYHIFGNCVVIRIFGA